MTAEALDTELALTCHEQTTGPWSMDPSVSGQAGVAPGFQGVTMDYISLIYFLQCKEQVSLISKGAMP